MKYIIYITTNQINGKIYIGLHKTNNPDVFDGYLGCGVYTNSPKSYMNGGTIFQRAVKKYGVKSFKRKILKVFNTLEEAKDFENLLVNEEFVKREDTYNMTIGGGYPPDLFKEVYQFDINGTFIKKWKNQIEITNHFNCYKDAIYESIKHKRSFREFYWAHESVINIGDYRLNKINKSIYFYNKDGILLNVFESLQDAANKLDLDKHSIKNSFTLRKPIEDCYFLTSDQNIFEVIEWRSKKLGNKKKVHRYTLDGEYVDSFKTLIEAAEACGLKTKDGISAAIKDPNKTSGNYRWSLIKADRIPEVAINSVLTPSPVQVFDLNGNFVKQFNTVHDCLKEFPYCRKVLRGERKSAHNYIFKYIN